MSRRKGSRACQRRACVGTAPYANGVPSHHSVKIDVADISTTLTQNICVVLRYTSLGLQGAETGSATDAAHLPGTWFAFNTGPLDVEATKTLRSSAEAWILTNAFRTLTMLIDLALARAWNYCGLLDLGRQGPVPIPRVQTHNAELERFQEANFPDKLISMREKYGEDVLPSLTRVIETWRDVRNCLEHQYGVVSARKPKRLVDGHLELQWQYIAMFHVSDSGEEKALVPEPGKSGSLPGGGIVVGPGRIERRILTHTKRFRVGAPVTITRQELVEMCLTAHVWGQELSRSVGRFTGPPTGSQPPTGDPRGA